LASVAGSRGRDRVAKLAANVVVVPSNEPEGTVVAQNPVGGTLRQGSTVRLNVSQGPVGNHDYGRTRQPRQRHNRVFAGKYRGRTFLSGPRIFAGLLADAVISSEREIVGIIAFIVLGLVAGFIAKALLPGDDPGGFIVTAIIGVVGALLGGFIAAALFDAHPLDEFFDISTWLTAIAGSALLLLAYRLVMDRNTHGRRSLST
jgi:uncharacterized membrane protein YeaQ/YmgE (transglycosylase-associated protein family)